MRTDTTSPRFLRSFCGCGKDSPMREMYACAPMQRQPHVGIVLPSVTAAASNMDTTTIIKIRLAY